MNLLLIVLAIYSTLLEPTSLPSPFVEAADSLKRSQSGLTRIGLEKRTYLSINPEKTKGYRPISINLPIGIDERTIIVTVNARALTLDTDYVIRDNPKQLAIINQQVVGSGANILISYVRPRWENTYE